MKNKENKSKQKNFDRTFMATHREGKSYAH